MQDGRLENVLSRELRVRPGLDRVDGSDGKRYVIGNLDILLGNSSYVLENFEKIRLI